MGDVKSFAVAPNETLEEQIGLISGSEAYEGERVRIMPDAHAGKGSCVGFTSTYSDRIVPNTVGVDIACRVSHVKTPLTLDDATTDFFGRVDEVVHQSVPTGFHVRDIPHPLSESFPYDEIHYWEHDDRKERHVLSMGTLGGGNHFIELDSDDGGNVWLSVHTGSRNLGLQVCNYYQGIADSNHPDLGELAYVEGRDMDDYLNDMRYCNQWSYLNHVVIMESIFDGLGLEFDRDAILTCIHNYVDVDNGFIRKGAISARPGEVGSIPLNMRDGILLVRAVGDEDWNYSLPHGAGRVLSRNQAKKTLDVDEFRDQMRGVYSTTVNEATLDEAPGAYKSATAIIESIRDRAELVERLVPIYNFKDDSEPVRRRKGNG